MALQPPLALPQARTPAMLDGGHAGDIAEGVFNVTTFLELVSAHLRHSFSICIQQNQEQLDWVVNY